MRRAPWLLAVAGLGLLIGSLSVEAKSSSQTAGITIVIPERRPTPSGSQRHASIIEPVMEPSSVPGTARVYTTLVHDGSATRIRHTQIVE